MKLLVFLGKIKNRVLASNFIHKLFKVKWYFDLGSSSIGWVTTKFQDIAAIIIILGFLKLSVSPENMFIGVIIAIFGIFAWGYANKNLGFFDRRTYVAKDKDPVMYEIWRMAKDYNERKKK